MVCTPEENTFFNDTLDSLAHFGVPGMKWGVRNEDTLRKYGLRKFGTKPIEKLGNKRARLEKRMRNVDTKIAKREHKIRQIEAKKVDIKLNKRQAKLHKLERKMRSAQAWRGPHSSKAIKLEKKVFKQQRKVDKANKKADKLQKLKDKNAVLIRKTRKVALKAAAMDSAAKSQGKAVLKKYRETSVKDLQLLDWNSVNKKY